MTTCILYQHSLAKMFSVYRVTADDLKNIPKEFLLYYCERDLHHWEMMLPNAMRNDPDINRHFICHEHPPNKLTRYEFLFKNDDDVDDNDDDDNNSKEHMVYDYNQDEIPYLIKRKNCVYCQEEKLKQLMREQQTSLQHQSVVELDVVRDTEKVCEEIEMEEICDERVECDCDCGLKYWGAKLSCNSLCDT